MGSINNGDQNTTSELLEAQTHVWHHTFNFVTSMSLKCAVQLGIPDAVNSHGKPITLPDLVAALKIPPTKSPYLHRLLRVLVHSGFLSVSDDFHGGSCYSLTRAGKLLVKDNPFNATAFVRMILDPAMFEPYHFMSAWFMSETDDETTPFYTAHGKMVWEHMVVDPTLSNVFNDAMAGDSSLVGEMLVNEGKSFFEGVGSLVDVAGGTGNMTKAIAASFPEMDCTVLDLPHVVSGLEGGGNLKYVAGDMFESIPHADVVLFKWILHDWSDENCVKILKNCKKAVTSNEKSGKVMIIDMVLGDQKWDEKMVATQDSFDMEMMMIASGKERNEEEWRKLFKESGFSNCRINPILGIRALIELYP
ncbi:Trans-resveratrol di-O-methyltransferase [Linum perenne]